MQKQEQQQKEIDVSGYDAETIHMLECLARDILKRPLIKRQRFLAEFERKNGEKITDVVKLYLSKEFNKRVAAKNKRLDENQAMREKLKR